jgi:transcriptional regulator with XRE-family HTH domain
MMDKAKRKALGAAGFAVGDAADFLGLTEQESRMVELRLALGRAVRERRKLGKLTQRQLAARMGSSRSHVARIESAAEDVSLDLMFSGLFAAGGGLSDLSSGRDYSRPDYPYGIFVLTADDRCSLGTEASLRRPMTPTRARAAEPQAVVKVSGVS